MSEIGNTRIIWTKKGYTAMFRLVGSKQDFVRENGAKVYFPSMEQAASGAGLALKAAHDAREKGRQREKIKTL